MSPVTPMMPTPEQIQRWMTTYHVTTRMLAEHLCYGSDHTRRIVMGKRRLMPDTASRLIAYFQERREMVQRDIVTICQLDRAA